MNGIEKYLKLYFLGFDICGNSNGWILVLGRENNIMVKKDEFWSERLSKSTNLKCPKCGSDLRESIGSWTIRGFYFCRKCGYSEKTLK